MRAHAIALLLLPGFVLAAGYRNSPFSDQEVEEIKVTVSELYPGAITTIGGASEGCACEEGPDCTSQSLVNVLHQGKHFSLSLSRIEGRWGIGKLQGWELKRQAFQFCNYPAQNAPAEAFQAFRSCKIAEHKMWASKPSCTAPNNSFKADSKPLRGSERP